MMAAFSSIAFISLVQNNITALVGSALFIGDFVSVGAFG